MLANQPARRKTSTTKQLKQKEETSMRYIYMTLIVGATIIVLLFVFENTLSTTVSFFSASVTLPLSIIVLAAYVMGILTGGVVVSSLRALIHGATKEQSQL